MHSKFDCNMACYGIEIFSLKAMKCFIHIVFNSWNNSDANKSVFDWCKEGNVKKMDVLLSKGESINAKDEQVSIRVRDRCE